MIESYDSSLEVTVASQVDDGSHRCCDKKSVVLDHVVTAVFVSMYTHAILAAEVRRLAYENVNGVRPLARCRKVPYCEG